MTTAAKSIEIVWTALPAGVPDPGNVLRLSVHISPRLKTNEGGARPTLEQFEDYFADWPATVRGLKFDVRFDPGPTIATQRVSEPSSELWAALFPLDTYVRPYEFRKLDDRLIFSYPVTNVQAHIQGIYQKYAQRTPDRFPSREDLRADDDLLAIRFVHDPREAAAIDALLGRIGTVGAGQQPPTREAFRQELIRRMRRTAELKRGLRGPANALAPGEPEPALDFFQVANFFTPQSKRKPDRAVTDKYGTSGTIKGEYERLPATIPLPDIDFHQIVSMLAQYPKLLRDLGLVIDLDVPLEDGIVGDAGAPDLPTVQVIPTWPGDAPTPTPSAVQPKTVYLLKAERFAAKPEPEDPELSETGLLQLSQEGYELVQIDVDGAALKTMNFSYNLYRSIVHRSADSALDSSLPALRSAGLSVARTGGALRLATKLQLMTAREANLPGDPTPTLYAEDVLRGYRIDIWDEGTGRWRSLHQRVGKYAFDAGPERSYQDEGFTQIAVASSADDSSSDLFLHEVFAGWEGWSLSAPRPGAWLTDESSSERERDRASTELKMETAFTALPGSLPRLRFGTGYRLRVRSVDLAGNSPTFDVLVPDTAPALLNPVGPDDPAASDERTYYRFEPVSPPVVVLRDDIATTPGASLERLIIRSFNDDPAKDEQPTDEVSERHIAPPKGPWTLAEAHGMLDLPPSGANDPDKLREIHTLIVEKDGAFPATKPAPTSQEPGAVNPIVAADTIAELPYLPDPIGRGTSFINLPGVPAGESHHMTAGGSIQVDDLQPAGTSLSLARVDFRPGSGDAWYDLGSFRLRVLDATGRSDTGPEWDAGQRTLTVYLPKADVVEVPYSSFLAEDDLDLMGIWDWIAREKPGNLSLLRRLALDGRHWMLTPRRTLVLVHAAQQPLGPPAFGTLEAERSFGWTHAALRDTLQIHGKSTSKVDVRAEWGEWIDALSEPEPRRIIGTAHVCELKAHDPTEDTLALAHNHNFGDTKYRRVRYRATATTRFRDYLPADLLDDETKITRTTIDEPQGPGEEPYRSVDLDVANSARPDAPKLLYVVPAFQWKKGSADSLQDIAAPGEPPLVSRREGGWLRVYLDRPWYSSGDGERLGVLFWNGEFTKIPPQYRPYVTQWGSDPIWMSAPASGRASLDSFKAATASKVGGLTLDELAPPAAMPLAPLAARLTVQDPVPLSQTQVGQLKAEMALVKGEKPPAGQAGVKGVVAKVDATSIPTLAVAGHDVKYDAGRRLWYADVHVDAGNSYYTFVRLALVRFQPISVANAHISRVVLADFAQLAPDRSVTLQFDPKRPREVALSVYGMTFRRSEAMKEPGPLSIRVEQLRSDVPEELGWIPARGADIDRGKHRGRGPRPMWTGKITLPEPRGSRRYRVVIQEFEQYAAVPTGTGRRRSREPTRISRLVYAHAIEL